ncbi:RTA1-domain-containing protein [Aspergillus ellipticus CBS 707.79]|uniref:RTA1-domain-containing protein n=1 Tax=Aspergillus ellipticus CBS 707.79 TaxID=1448320 RepID=A0A319EA30_9EURO|nr:RTA1-domain-containing protein [Aspergillus ellipticus CBS 707.79]
MEWVLCYFTPSLAAAVMFVALFGLSTILHFQQMISTRTWFMITFIIGGILETIGYIGRILSAIEAPNYTVGPYAMQSALILIAPAFLAATIYMELGRIINLTHAESPYVVRPKWLTAIFVAGDVISFLMQASGAGLMVESPNNPTSGEHIILGGLFVQIIFFGFFLITSFLLQLRLRRSPTAQSVELRGLWRKHLYCLYAAGILIFCRSIIRVVEYLQGYDGYLATHQVFIYVFDALLMFGVMCLFHAFHPSELNCFLGRAEKYVSKGLFIRGFVPSVDEEKSTDAV